MIDLDLMGVRLRQARIRTGLSQDDVSHIAGLSIRTIRRCEAGGTTNLITLEKLCKAYTVSINDMIGGESDLLRLAESINRLGPNACEVIISLCRAMRAANDG